MRSRTKLIGGLALAAASITVLGACSSSSTGGTTPAASGTPVTGGTAVLAEPPTTTPNYIFPFTSSAYISVINQSYLAFLMYRPLYWFGNGAQPTLNTALSIANPPTFSGNNVTITLKHYVWSNGSQVTATDVMFWLNMEAAVGATDYGAYTGFPNTEISNLKVVSPTELTFTMNKAYNPQWMLYNNLSQITPMPAAWDLTAANTPGHCATTISDCKAVYTYLDSQAKNMGGYVGSPLWSVVDGP